MSAITKLLAAQNEFINPVLKALMDNGTNAPVMKLKKAQQDEALVVGGILLGVKVAIIQATKMIEEMELDDVI